MNPNFLYRDELEYELGLRRFKTEGDAPQLRKSFRSEIKGNEKLQWDYLTSASAVKWICEIEVKICELQDIVKQSAGSLISVLPRARTRLLHLRGRLSHLTDASLCTTKEEVARVERLYEQLDSIGDIMASAEQVEQGGDGRTQGQTREKDASQPVHEVRSSPYN
jgi:hypothetical protein